MNIFISTFIQANNRQIRMKTSIYKACKVTVDQIINEKKKRKLEISQRSLTKETIHPLSRNF